MSQISETHFSLKSIEKVKISFENSRKPLKIIEKMKISKIDEKMFKSVFGVFGGVFE